MNYMTGLLLHRNRVSDKATSLQPQFKLTISLF